MKVLQIKGGNSLQGCNQLHWCYVHVDNMCSGPSHENKKRSLRIISLDYNFTLPKYMLTASVRENHVNINVNIQVCYGLNFL
jgi:hypothetical protein